MDNKPWQDKGPRRSFDGEESDRRGHSDRFDRFDRFDRSDRSDRRDFGDRRPFGERKSFGDRPRFDRSDRFERSDRRDFGERRSFGDRKPFGEGRGFGDRPRFDRKPGGRRFGEGQGRREDFGVRSGPRARAYDTRRFAERSDFARNAMVKIDSDIADFFGSPEAVNQALRLLIDAARVVKLDAVKPAVPETVEPETAAQLYAADVDEDDVEDSDYGEAADEADAAQAKPEAEPAK